MDEIVADQILSCIRANKQPMAPKKVVEVLKGSVLEQIVRTTLLRLLDERKLALTSDMLLKCCDNNGR